MHATAIKFNSDTLDIKSIKKISRLFVDAARQYIN